jgi:hypothetical protein
LTRSHGAGDGGNACGATTSDDGASRGGLTNDGGAVPASALHVLPRLSISPLESGKKKGDGKEEPIVWLKG